MTVSASPALSTIGWLVSWMVGWLIGWLVGWMSSLCVGWLFSLPFCQTLYHSHSRSLLLTPQLAPYLHILPNHRQVVLSIVHKRALGVGLPLPCSTLLNGIDRALPQVADEPVGWGGWGGEEGEGVKRVRG